MLLNGYGILLISFLHYATSQSSPSPKIYELVDDVLITPQWLETDTYDTSRQASLIDQTHVRYPHKEQRYEMTKINRELLLLSSEDVQLIPNVKDQLQIGKSLKRFIPSYDFRPIFANGLNAKHRFAEGMNFRRRNFGNTDEVMIPFLFLPTGWPIFLIFLFICTLFIVPLLGSILVHTGFKAAVYYHLFFWGPLKIFIRMILIKSELYDQKWRRFLAPPYFLEPRPTMKIPYLLRNHVLEDIPPEVAYKPPINDTDYTMYILSPEDYDECDLEVDELEFIDDLLQFRDEDPKTVARLLKYKLGDDKFYYYFEEDILSSEEDEEEEEEKDIPPPNIPKPLLPVKTQGREAPVPTTKDQDLEDKELAKSLETYLAVIEVDEPWMHDEFDLTFKGNPIELEEVQKRRAIIKSLQKEIDYIRTILQDNKYSKNMSDQPIEKRITLQNQAKRLLGRYLRFSDRTKERISELEPSSKVQTKHNIALSKYLPLINKLSHYNHRLNLKHEKQKDPAKRKAQLDVFGGP